MIIRPLGYRGIFGALAAVGAMATLIIAVRIPETAVGPQARPAAGTLENDVASRPQYKGALS